MEKITLFTETAIDSCHRLNDYEGKCKNLHGHTWLVQVWIQGDNTMLDKTGILYDFGKIKEIHEFLDHKEINAIVDFNPTAENISFFIVDWLRKEDLRKDYRVRVYETAVLKKTYCQRQTEGFDAKYC